MLAGDLYLADDPELAEASTRALDLADAYNATTVRQGPLRRRLLEELLGAIGDRTEIRPPFHVDYGSHIRFGARCFANFGLVALDVAPITIGDDVQIGPNVQLLTPTHPVEPEPRRDKWEAAEPITIGDNVWLGGGAIVLPGVTIGENTVVGADQDVAAASHRSIARAADVPLGSLTYHFGSLTDLLAAAFTRPVDTVAARFDERMAAAPDRATALEVLVQHLTGDLLGSPRDLVLAVELYVAAARDPALRAVTQDWMSRSRRSLERHLDPVTAREVDALVEGLVLHSALSTDPMDAAAIRSALHRLAGR